MGIYQGKGCFTETEIALISLLAQDRLFNDSDVDLFSNVEQIRAILNLSIKAKVLPNILIPLASRVPKEIQPLLIFEQEKHRKRRQHLLKTLLDISAGFTAQSLRFVVIKGLSLSHTIYDDLFARQFNDIDILVASQDIPGADFVLRSKGFHQPIPHHAKGGNRSVSQVLQPSFGRNAPFPIRAKDSDNHLIPYYSNKTGCKIEIHDGIENLPAWFIRDTLWNVDFLKIDDRQIRIPNAIHTAAILFAVTHNNMNNFFARFDGECNLRDLVDVHTLLQQQNFEAPELTSLLKSLEIEDGAHDVMMASNKLYDIESGLNLTDSQRPFARNDIYLKQAMDGRFSTALVVDETRNHCKRSTARKASAEKENRCAAPIADLHVENSLGIPLKVQVNLNESEILIEWNVKGNAARDLNLLAFRIILIPGSSTPHFAYQADFGVNENGLPISRFVPKRRPSPRLTNIVDGTEIPSTISRGQDTVTIKQRIPQSCLDFNPSNLKQGVLTIPIPYIRNSPLTFKDIATEDRFSSLSSALIRYRKIETSEQL